MDPDRLLDGLDEGQRRAVTTAVVPLCILAGAGSGKTRVLTRRIAYRAETDQHDARRVLALTFTRKAAGELTARLRALGLRDSVVAGTFHGVAYAQLRTRWADRRITPPTLLDRKVPFVHRLLDEQPRSHGTGRRATSGGNGSSSSSARTGNPARRSGAGTRRAEVPRATLVADVVAEIEWAKARRIAPDDYPAAVRDARRRVATEPDRVAELFAAYERTKRDRRMVDFDDLLSLCTRDLTRDAEFATAQRWRFRHLFVDEYQDVNPLQQALLEAWLGERTDLCVVGDPNQAIYAWNGADPTYLTEFTQRWQRGEVVRLEDNYRSSPQILAAAQAVLHVPEPRGGRPGAPARPRRPAAPPPGLRPNRPEGPAPSVRAYDDDQAEARGIARAVRDLHRPGAPWSSQAVLVRTHAQTPLIEAALREARIPSRVRGGSGLVDQPEVVGALKRFRGRNDPISVVVADLGALARRLDDRLDEDDVPDPLADEEPAVVPDAPTAGSGRPDEDSRAANIEALIRLAHDYAAMDQRATAGGFVSWLGASSRADAPDGPRDAVEIVTFHAAKGLEWPVVHLAGIEQGLVPISRAQTAAALAEERRLFYVAVTRAEQVLRCTWARRRTFGTRTVDREPSPYLAVVAPDAAPADLGTAASGAGDGSAVPRGRRWDDERTPASPRPARSARPVHPEIGVQQELPDQQEPPVPAARSGRPTGAPTATGEDRQRATRATRAPDALDPLPEADRAAHDALLAWRERLARAADIAPAAVLDDAVLRALAAQRPTTIDEVAAVAGIGPIKVGRFGPGVLEALAAAVHP